MRIGNLRSVLGRTALLLALPALLQCGGGGGGDPPAAPADIAIEPAFPALTFDSPLFLTTAPGDNDRVFVVTQAGVIYVFANDPAASTSKVFLDISDRVSAAANEMGLLGLAFDPDYADNGYFYVNYTAFTPLIEPRRTVISRISVSDDPDLADADSETELLGYPQPFGNHNGGWLGFGPDGKLYIASGDGGSANDPQNNAQDLGSPLGKILRINADGSVPADNPFVGTAGAREEIWAWGLRNPWRASFDRETGELWAGDVGQGAIEEIDLIERGGNYGWRKYEGTRENVAADPEPENAIFPIHEYAHENGRCSITGGYPYRGSALSGHAGTYFYADLCTGEVWRLRRNDDGSVTTTDVGQLPGNATSFGEDAAGELYLTSFDGSIYALVPQ